MTPSSPAEVLVVHPPGAPLPDVVAELEQGGCRVRTAADGLQGLASIMVKAPQLIIAKAQLAKMDGVALLRAVRSNERTASIPFIVLCEYGDPTDPQALRALGATLAVLLPVLPGQLLTALREIISRSQTPISASGVTATSTGLTYPFGRSAESSSAEASKLEQHTLPANFAQFVEGAPNTLIGDSEISSDAELEVSQLISKRNTLGTVLFSDIRNFTSVSERLDSEEVVEMLNAYFARACEPIQRQHGWVVKFLGDGLVALFESPPGHLQDHAERAVKAGLLMILAAIRFRAWIAERHPAARLPDFSIGVGIHTGEVTVCKMGGAESPETTIIGDTVNLSSRLEEKTKELGWSCVVSRNTFDGAGARIVGGRTDELTVKGRVQPVQIVEVLGLKPKIAATEHEMRFYEAVRGAVSANARTLIDNLRARSAVGAVMATSPSLPPAKQLRPLKIPGFTLVRKLGEGGMSLVWLAQRQSSGEEVVLKLLPLTDGDRRSERIERFSQEYALVSKIDHPNVARIFEQGFTDDYAYIAMEYFPGGDLRSLTKGGLKPEVAQAVLVQIAGALNAIHAQGIVHRDMKPDNVMLRSDGSLGLADFGIAKHVDSNFSHTRHGEVFGTPYYLSPEQALGQPVDHRSDLYSLGVMLFEMLTGKKPYYADSAQALLYQHVHAPVPVLPQSLARFQSLLSRMMAKRPQDRFATASELMDAIMKV